MGIFQRAWDALGEFGRNLVNGFRALGGHRFDGADKVETDPGAPTGPASGDRTRAQPTPHPPPPPPPAQRDEPRGGHGRHGDP